MEINHKVSHRHHTYNIALINSTPSSSVLGYSHQNCLSFFQGIINLSIRDGVLDQGTRIVSVEPIGAAKGKSSYLQRRLPNTETRTALLGNYLLSEGKPGKVHTYIVTFDWVGECFYVFLLKY